VYEIKVGQPLPVENFQAKEGLAYNFEEGSHTMICSWSNAKEHEIQAFKHNPAELAIAPIGPVLFLLYRCAGIVDQWGDAPYSWWINPVERRTPPQAVSDLEESDRIGLTMILCDPITRIVHAMRIGTLSTHATRALLHTIDRQIEAGHPGGDAYQEAVQAAYRRYPTAKDMVSVAAAKCKLGD
jgi:hypothetical protein